MIILTFRSSFLEDNAHDKKWQLRKEWIKLKGQTLGKLHLFISWMPLPFLDWVQDVSLDYRLFHLYILLDSG